MSDNTYCHYAKRDFTRAKDEFNESKPLKKSLETVLANAGQKEKEEEYRRNDIVTNLRDKEKEIRDAREKGQDDTDLENDRNKIVAALRACEEQIRQTREFIADKTAEHYSVSGKLRKLINDMEKARAEINSNCSQESRDRFDSTIPSFD